MNELIVDYLKHTNTLVDEIIIVRNLAAIKESKICKKLKETLEKSVEGINKAADDFVNVSSQNVHLKRNLKTFEVFLSHSGQDKMSIVGWIRKRLMPPEKEQMLYTAMTCQVGIVVLSKSSLILGKTWPILELAIFGARLRAKGGRKTNFKCLPYFMDRELGVAWTDIVLQTIPLPCEMSSGVQYKDYEHVQVETIFDATKIQLKANTLWGWFKPF